MRRCTGLRQVVADAQRQGIDLKIVVDRTQPADRHAAARYRDRGRAGQPGSTVLAISPSCAGTYSPTFDRVTLEAGQDIAKTGNPVQSSKNFVSELTTPPIFRGRHSRSCSSSAVLLAAVATRILQVRGKRRPHALRSPRKALPAAKADARDAIRQIRTSPFGHTTFNYNHVICD